MCSLSSFVPTLLWNTSIHLSTFAPALLRNNFAFCFFCFICNKKVLTIQQKDVFFDFPLVFSEFNRIKKTCKLTPWKTFKSVINLEQKRMSGSIPQICVSNYKHYLQCLTQKLSRHHTRKDIRHSLTDWTIFRFCIYTYKNVFPTIHQSLQFEQRVD